MSDHSSNQQAAASSVQVSSVFELLTPLAKRWKAVTIAPISFAVVAVAGSFLLAPHYKAQASLRATSGPDLAGSLGGLASLAGQLGVAGLPSAPASPDFYAEVLESRELLYELLTLPFRAYDVETTDGVAPLVDILEIEGDSYSERLFKGARRLHGMVSTGISRRSGVVTLEVEAKHPALAADIANRMVELLNTFSLERQRFQSREQRRFTGERLRQAEAELRDAETRHLRFLERNRSYAGSPLLAFEASRLERDVQVRQEVYLTLTREYEQARIAEVRDTPVLTIIDNAIAPERKSFPRRLLVLLGCLILGTVASACYAYLAEYTTDARRRSRSDYAALANALDRAREELARMLTLGRHRSGNL